MDIFSIIQPTSEEVPVIISSPHSGSGFPEDLLPMYRPEMISFPDDTDWYIDKLYDFAPNLGITMICANVNRWVIDLNRDPDSKPLYNDGRVITGLTPATNFNGESLYINDAPDEEEVARRLQTYYKPYHKTLESLIDEKVEKFGKVLLFDAHSIRKVVPGIRPEPFPDLILGDNDGKTAAPEISNAALDILTNSTYKTAYNHPFKGGYITRHYGAPASNIHALQLEMSKLNYMDDSETSFHEERAGQIRSLLLRMFIHLIETLE